MSKIGSSQLSTSAPTDANSPFSHSISNECDFSYSLSSRPPVICSLVAGCNARVNDVFANEVAEERDSAEPFLPPSSVIYYGRLQNRIAAWRRLASPYIVQWIEEGVPIEFVTSPAPQTRKSVIRNKTERLFAREQVAELLQRQCIRLNPNAKVICPLGVAPKKGPVQYRLIHNVRYVNRYCTPKRFKYEKLTDLQNIVKGGEWMVKFDLTAGYHHIPLKASQQQFFGFEFEGKVYSWQQLFFGLSPAPYIFTMILRDIARKWRFDGIILVHYLDDFCLFASSCSS